MMSKSAKTTHLERTAAEPRGTNLHAVTLSRVDPVNERVRLIRLSLSEPLEFLPGQWLDTYIPGVPQAGGFSITSPPAAAATDGSSSPYLELAVQKSPGNPPAAWLWHDEPARIIGQILHVRVGGSFTFPPPMGKRPKGLHDVASVVLVAGGVGVNPIMSILSHAGSAVHPRGNPHHLGLPSLPSRIRFTIAYASRVPEEGAGGIGGILFLDRIEAVLRSGAVDGSLSLFLTNGGDGRGLSEVASRQWEKEHDHRVHQRRMAEEDLRALVGDPERTLVYICGPPGMTDEFHAFLTSSEGLRMDTSQVIVEKWW